MTAKNDKTTNGTSGSVQLSDKKLEQKIETEELLELAKQKQKQRLDALKTAPAEAQMIVEMDEREELARFHVPDAYIHEKPENWRKPGTKGEYKKGSTKVAMWTGNTPEARRKMANAGYLPVLDDGIQVSSGGGDILWEGPIEFEKVNLDRAAKMHIQRIKDEGVKYEREIASAGVSAGGKENNSLTFEQGE